jgi:hypothetical protein
MHSRTRKVSKVKSDLDSSSDALEIQKERMKREKETATTYYTQCRGGRRQTSSCFTTCYSESVATSEINSFLRHCVLRGLEQVRVCASRAVVFNLHLRARKEGAINEIQGLLRNSELTFNFDPLSQK